MPPTQTSIDAARPPTRTLALRRSLTLAPLSGLIQRLAEMIQDTGPTHKELSVELGDRQPITISQMVDGFRRHIPHPAMVTEEVPNAFRSPDQITLFRHLLNEPRNEIPSSNVSGYHRSATGIRCPV